MAFFFVQTVFFLTLMFLVLARTKTVLAYFQQEEYDASRFVNAFFRVRLYDIVSSVALIFALVASYLTRYFGFFLLVASGIFVAVALKEQKYKLKKAFVRTERSQRICLLALAIIAVAALSVFIHPVFALIVLQMPAFAIMAANWILTPFQNRINETFIEEARERLAVYRGLRIGITGSFGKTSIKHVLGHVLAMDRPVFFSKGSVNTILGLTRHIRHRLQHSHHYFIAEMGAYQKGSIHKLCEFIQPEYGVVSSVGDAHTERFGSVEEIARAKSELAVWVCEHGKTIVTTEDVVALKPFAELRARHPEKFVVCGHSDAASVQIIAEEVNAKGWHMTLRFNDFRPAGIEEVVLQVPLLGQHNIMNVALIAALVSRIAPKLVSRMANSLTHVPQIPHRLQMKEQANGPTILDDAYNSNENGFINAVTSLQELTRANEGRGILVTPGVAELGSAHDEVHRRLAKIAVEKCDMICVVGPERISSFVETVRRAGYDSLHTFPGLKEAQAFLKTENLTSRDVILYENDLPDLLESRRVL